MPLPTDPDIRRQIAWREQHQAECDRMEDDLHQFNETLYYDVQRLDELFHAMPLNSWKLDRAAPILHEMQELIISAKLVARNYEVKCEERTFSHEREYRESGAFSGAHRRVSSYGDRF